MLKTDNIQITPELLTLVAEVDEFKGAWRALGTLAPERLKALRASVDVLTMTATPIPRTLHMSLLGARSISNLETPPKDRLAVETRVARFDETLLRHAILRELNRGGEG